MNNQTELVAGLVEGRGKAFEELVATYGRRLLAKAEQMLGNREDARECVQECYIQVHRKIGSFRDEAKLYSWVHRILINACLTRIRARPRSLVENLEDCEATMGGDCNWAQSLWQEFVSPDDIIDNIHLKNIVMGAIRELPQSYQQIINLRDIQGYSTVEVSTMLAISETAAKVRLHRAHGLLRDLLEPYRDDC